jgi:hypothetical protein
MLGINTKNWVEEIERVVFPKSLKNEALACRTYQLKDYNMAVEK